MKKYAILIMILFMGYHASSYAQAVDDRAVVPLSVTLNSILRLNIESGGNIEFNFNTLEQYQNGINSSLSSDQYATLLTVASSVNFDLSMGAEDTRLVSTDTVNALGGMPLGHIVYNVEMQGSLTNNNVTLTSSPTALSQIQDAEANEIVQPDGTNAGGVTANAFRVNWACGVPTSVSGFSGTEGALMGSEFTGGRYSTNIFFVLEPTD